MGSKLRLAQAEQGGVGGGRRTEAGHDCRGDEAPLRTRFVCGCIQTYRFVCGDSCIQIRVWMHTDDTDSHTDSCVDAYRRYTDDTHDNHCCVCV
jgi:hypothetical protein